MAVSFEDIKKQFKFVVQAFQKQYDLSEQDIHFLGPDNQWPDEVKTLRSGRPTYAADRLNAQVKQLTNAQRENRPAVTVHAVNSEADEETAEVLQGIVRHIEYQSNADLAYDDAFESCVRSGIGFWRLTTKYEEKSFNQCICIEPIVNPFQVYVDPNYKMPDGSDIEFAFITEVLTRDEYKQLYPDKESGLSACNNQTWASLNRTTPEWFGEGGKTCTVAEYFVKEYKEKTICQLEDGRIVYKDELKPKDKVVREREEKEQVPVVKWYKCNGMEILEEREWPGKFIPVIPIFGDALLDKGERIYSGLVRKCKEEQIMLNVLKSTAVETIAATPKSPWVGPVGFVGDRGEVWANANILNPGYLMYEVEDDQKNPLAPPTRNTSEPPIQGVLEMINSVENDIKATNGMYDPSLGNKMSNDQSGVAVKALQSQGSIGNYHYSDNLSRAIRLEGKMLIDLIPKIYDTEQVIRVIGIDEKHKLVKINSEVPDPININKDGIPRIYDITSGIYDVTVSSGPSYQTQKEADRNALFDVFSKDPALIQIAGDLLFSTLDSPIGIKLAERFTKTLPPQLQPQDANSPQANLPPQIQQQLQQQQQMIQQLTQTLQKETELADKVTQDQQTKLQIAKLQNDTEIAKHKASLQHESNSTLLKLEIERLKEEGKQSHSLLLEVHKHLLDKDMASHNANLEQATQNIQAPPPSAQTYHEPVQ